MGWVNPVAYFQWHLDPILLEIAVGYRNGMYKSASASDGKAQDGAVMQSLFLTLFPVAVRNTVHWLMSQQYPVSSPSSSASCNLTRLQWSFPRGPYLRFLLPSSQSLVWSSRQATRGRPHTIVCPEAQTPYCTTASQTPASDCALLNPGPITLTPGKQDSSLSRNLTNRLLRYGL